LGHFDRSGKISCLRHFLAKPRSLFNAPTSHPPAIKERKKTHQTDRKT
jgi:hypothetical protein